MPSLFESDDARLLEQVAAGDRDALALLSERHSRGVFRFVRAVLGDDQLAEDVVQETFVGVWRGAHGFAGRSAASTWILAIARRRAVDARRKVGMAVADGEAPERAAPIPSPEEHVLARARAEDVRRALALLSPLHREALLLAFDRRLSYEEMALVLEVPVGTVKSRLSNARRALRARLGDPSR